MYPEGSRSEEKGKVKVKVEVQKVTIFSYGQSGLQIRLKKSNDFR